MLTRVINGTLRKGAKIRLMSNGRVFDVESLGVLTPKPVEIGAVRRPARWDSFPRPSRMLPTRKSATPSRRIRVLLRQALPGFEDIQSMVFAGLYTVDSHEHTLLRDALEKLRLNDSSFFFEPESSVALGFGFRCGFLGLLHMEIIQERLEREYQP